jgi:tetratricopeptide (TPR) repeat protein
MPARLGQASALLTLGRADEALEEYRKVADQDPAARVTVARLLLTQNLRRPQEQRTQHWPEVDRALDEADQAMPNSIEVVILRADALAARGQLDQARDRLDQARDRQPSQVELWIALAHLAVSQGKPEAMLGVLDEARQQLGDRVELRLARTSYWGRRGGQEAPKALEQLGRDLDQFSAEDRLRLEDGLAGAFARLGDLDRAERLWTRVADQRPDDLRTANLLLDLAFQTGDMDAVQRAVDRLRRIEGEDGTLWRYGEVGRLTLLVRRGDTKPLGAARLMLAEVARRRPEWSRVPLLEAEIAELEGNPERAIEAYVRAIDRGEREPRAIRRVVGLLNARRRFAEADRVVQKLLEQAPPSGTLGQLAAEMSLRHQDQQRALELASRAVSSDSKDYRDHLWLGQLYLATGRRAEAGTALRRAVTLAGDAPETWVGYVEYLARTDPKDRPVSLQTIQVEDAIHEARSKLPPDRASLALAHCYETTGHVDQAEGQFQAALAANPGDAAPLQAIAGFYARTGQATKAEPYLREILDPRTKASESQMAWARRQTALRLTAQGGYPRIREALALIDRNLRAHGESVEDQRLKALLLTQQPGGRQEAIRIFEDLARRQPPTPDEKFLLAQFYEAGREWAKARELMLSLLASDGEDPLYLAAFTRSLLRQGQVDEADPWLTKLERLRPQDVQTVELKARALAARGQGAQAATMLKAYAQGKDVNRGRLAVLLEELGQLNATGGKAREADALFDAAGVMYSEYISQSKRPEATLLRAGFLARRGHLREALDLCEQARQTCPPEAIFQTSVEALYAAQEVDDEDCERVARWLEAAIQENPESIQPRFKLAFLRSRQGRYRDAEALYRQMIERGVSQGAPLNNLAWLLALQGSRESTEALELVNRAMAIDGPGPNLLDTRAVVHLALGRGDAALKDLERAVSIDPTAGVYFHLARAYLMSKDRSAAAAAWRKAKAAGLTAAALHPLERKIYEQVLHELERR